LNENQERSICSGFRYYALGLVGNPFIPAAERSGEALSVALDIQAEAHQLLVALEDQATAETSRPIWVEKTPNVPNYFHVGAETQVEEVLIADDDLGMLPCYVQLFVMHVGRIRANLNVLAERIATRSFVETLAVWVEQIIADGPDASLPEFQDLDAAEWSAFVESMSEDPVGAVSDLFGEWKLERITIDRQPADIREAALEPEPQEDEDSGEDDSFTSQMPSVSNPTVQMVPSEDGSGTLPVLTQAEVVSRAESNSVIALLVAHTRAHLSPVVARGLKAYVDRGAGQMMQEFKITKAPRKTFKALLRFAASNFRRVVFIYDGFDNWPITPEELRNKIIGSLTELRLAMAGAGTMVFMAKTPTVPDLAEYFGHGDRIEWDFAAIAGRSDLDNDNLDTSSVNRWVERATLRGHSGLGRADETPLKTIVDESGGSLAKFCQLAGHVVERAVAAGIDSIDEDFVREAISTGV